MLPCRGSVMGSWLSIIHSSSGSIDEGFDQRDRELLASSGPAVPDADDDTAVDGSGSNGERFNQYDRVLLRLPLRLLTGAASSGPAGPDADDDTAVDEGAPDADDDTAVATDAADADPFPLYSRIKRRDGGAADADPVLLK